MSSNKPTNKLIKDPGWHWLITCVGLSVMPILLLTYFECYVYEKPFSFELVFYDLATLAISVSGTVRFMIIENDDFPTDKVGLLLINGARISFAFSCIVFFFVKGKERLPEHIWRVGGPVLFVVLINCAIGFLVARKNNTKKENEAEGGIINDQKK